jgi:hypothetical protein
LWHAETKHCGANCFVCNSTYVSINNTATVLSAEETDIKRDRLTERQAERERKKTVRKRDRKERGKKKEREKK